MATAFRGGGDGGSSNSITVVVDVSLGEGV